jgi:hypothetical protein
MDASDGADFSHGSDPLPPGSLPSSLSPGGENAQNPGPPPETGATKKLTLAERRKLKLQELFLKALERCGNITAAAKAVKIHRRTFYDWAAADPAFAKRAELAYQAGENHAADMLEARLDEAGTAYGKGFNVTAAIFRLKALRPDKYRERLEHSGPGGKPLHPAEVTHHVKLDLKVLTDDELTQYTALVSKLAGRGAAGTLQGQN